MATPATDLLTQEYLAIFQVYESYNDQSLIIKGWSVTVGMAALIAAYASKPAERPGTILVVLAACSVLPFYLTDAIWKAVQEGYHLRLLDIEGAIARGTSIDALQMFTTWSQKFHLGPAEFLAAAVNPTVMLPHLPIFVAGLLLAWLRPPTST